MRSICSTEEMQKIERLQIKDDIQVATGLMECAGTKAAESIIEWSQEAGRKSRNHFHVLCGPGNNGGDGFVIARTLFDLGKKVSCWELGNPTGKSSSSTLMRSKWLQRGSIAPIGQFQMAELKNGDIVVDALFGIGLTRPLDKKCSIIFERIPSSVPIIAIDILSGLNSTSGELLSVSDLPAYKAALTLTFQLAKWGHYLQEGSARSGKIEVLPIGLDKGMREYNKSNTSLVELVDTNPPDFAKFLDKHGASHKYDHGHALILSGSQGKMGAAELAGASALRIGSGLVTLGLPRDAFQIYSNNLKALMVTPADEPKDLQECLEDTRINALCLGPGLGLGRKTREFTNAALASGRNVVLDADALTSFKDNHKSLFMQLHEKTVLTPHFGEFAKLFPDLATRMKSGNYPLLTSVQKASTRSGAIILLKGRQTVVASPDGKTYLVDGVKFENSSWLATAGSGDVLAGMITGLMARNITPLKSAVLSVYLHLKAASLLGPGLIADDIPNTIPRVIGHVLNQSP
ncbi:MAG: NAD(P)H-hydrate dehydratase [Rhodobacteraceae bacterium]|nr:NAD(P)H-hydrate dehydratase [Paracoccaceae bacterium]MCY4249397.1 NAD(P)H-hydrate dehydratase [Paracoccaceae bacterium]MCY4307876.1 NAD(P)H-hydrate dehydratase [Paracoccaceae bacterium]